MKERFEVNEYTVLDKSESVVFVNPFTGEEVLEGQLEVRWSDSNNSWYEDFREKDVDGYLVRKRVYSNTVERKTAKKRKANKNCKMVEINPDHETEKAYAIYECSNGCVSRGNSRVFYKYVAKSICKIEGEKVLAPIWALM